MTVELDGRARTVGSVELTLRVRLRAGEPTAFGELFDDHAQAVYQHGLRLSGDRAVAEDVVSMTFLQAWRLRGRIDADGGTLRPWLLGIATNMIRNQTRKTRRERDLLARLAPRERAPDFADELVARIDDAARLSAVRQALSRLRPAEREVVALCVWAGLDYAGAAEALGIPIGTVRSRLSRARQRLADLRSEPEPAWRQVEGDRMQEGRA